MGKEKDKKPLFGGIFQKFFKPSAKAEAKKKKEHHLTVQRSIPYLEMGRDGICRVEEHLYSKTVRFYDINYQLAQNEDKNTIFESWCDFLNYFDSSIRFQLSFINHKSDMSEYNKVIQIEPQHDQFDDVRMEYAQMLKQQLAKGNNGLVRTKYITFSIEAKSVKEAKPRLERIETDILNNFKVLGVKAYPLNGVERLQIMYEMFHQEEERKFEFSYDRILQSGMTTKDFIAPTSFLFKSGKDFQMGDTIGAVSYLNILAPELTDKVLAEFLDMDKNLVVSIHVQSVDQLKAIKLIKGKITDLDRMKIEEQKKAVRSGYDMEIIPSDLATYGGEAKKILDDLQSRNERMFLMDAGLLQYRKRANEIVAHLMAKDDERTAVYREYERRSISLEQVEEYEHQYQVAVQKQEAAFKKVMLAVNDIEKAFSHGNPWLMKFRAISIPETLERTHLKEWLDHVWIVDFEQVEVILQESEWKRFFPEEWLNNGEEDCNGKKE